MIKTKAFFLSIGYGCLVALFCYLLTLIIGLFLNDVETFFGWEHLVAILIVSLIIFPGVGHLYVRNQPFSSGQIWVTSVCIAIFGVIVSVLLDHLLMNRNNSTGDSSFLNDHAFLWIGMASLLAVFLARAALYYYFYLLKRTGILSAFNNELT